MRIDDRKKKILTAIVSLYSNEGEPIGSGLLSQHIGLCVSTATLRSEMAALTKLGMLVQPHTSSGRIPSIGGYRYFVENLLSTSEPLKRDIQQLDSSFEQLDNEAEKLAMGAARAISDILRLAAFVTIPKNESMTFAKYRLVQVGKRTVAIVAISSLGGVHTRVVKLVSDVTGQLLAEALQLLNGEFCFACYTDITNQKINSALTRLTTSARLILKSALMLLQEASQARVYFEGQTMLFKQGIKDLQCISSLLDLISEKESFAKLVYSEATRYKVIFGEDIEPVPIRGVVIASQQYHAGGGLTGSLGVVGTERMDYSQVLPRLTYAAEVLSNIKTNQI